MATLMERRYTFPSAGAVSAPRRGSLGSSSVAVLRRVEEQPYLSRQLAASQARYFLFPALNGRTINSGVS